jgi:ribosome-binding factor A
VKSYARSERVASEIQRELAVVLFRHTNDPRLADVLITGVKMTADLKLATIYFHAPGDGQRRDAALAGLQSAAGHLKRELSGRLKLRYMPELRFFYDDSFDYGQHIERVLKKIHEQSTNAQTGRRDPQS